MSATKQKVLSAINMLDNLSDVSHYTVQICKDGSSGRVDVIVWSRIDVCEDTTKYLSMINACHDSIKKEGFEDIHITSGHNECTINGVLHLL